MSKRIDEITVVNSASDSANVLIEDNGMLKRMPASNMGGSGNQPPMILYFGEGTRPENYKNVYSSYKDKIQASRYDIIEAMISGRDVLVVSYVAEPGAADSYGNPLVDDYGNPVEPPFGCYKAISIDYNGYLLVYNGNGLVKLYTLDDNYM